MNELWNDDKHKHPVVIASASRTNATRVWEQAVPVDRIVFHHVTGRRERQVIAEVDVPWNDRGDVEMSFKPQAVFDFVDITGHGEPVVRFLSHASSHLRDFVLPMFEESLASGK
ncbi:MAG: hypothetical protein O3B95_10610 [Chloroflexi bacterium]|nr:hypothetical protein [Chloroflexota bacterium]